MTSRHTLASLQVLAARMWAESSPGDVIWLQGDLGSGKTTFAQLVCETAGAVDGSSPTYALVHEYGAAEGTVLHVDCYRLNDPAEAYELDLDAHAADARLTMIEWPEKGGDGVPRPTRTLTFSHADDHDVRNVTVQP